ncbi:MAG: hypothetical protein ACPHCJ_07010 [Oceanococcaceae bacterium]
MKLAEVPQDHNAAYEEQKRAVYAVDDAGQYVLTQSDGWSVEDAVNSLAVEEFDRLAAQALLAAQAGQQSPLAFHMYARRMDIPTLAQATGLWQWRVRRHLKADAFAGLSASLRERYAQALGMPVEQLQTLPTEAEHAD